MRVGVTPAARRMGFASELLKVCLRRARDKWHCNEVRCAPT
jgi:GNAT superfamily N-acetyltransferase